MNHFCDVCDRGLHERCNIYFRGPKSFRCRRCNEKPQQKEMPLWAKLTAMPPITYHVPAQIQPMAEKSEEESGERRTPDISGESPSDRT